jgi:hypothetical protein
MFVCLLEEFFFTLKLNLFVVLEFSMHEMSGLLRQNLFSTVDTNCVQWLCRKRLGGSWTAPLLSLSAPAAGSPTRFVGCCVAGDGALGQRPPGILTDRDSELPCGSRPSSGTTTVVAVLVYTSHLYLGLVPWFGSDVSFPHNFLAKWISTPSL